MSPRYVNREEKTRMIARAALALYAQKGFAATGVDQIATAAGVGKGTLYEYFESKADIFVAAILEWMKQLTEQFADRLEKIDDPILQLRAFTEMTIELVDPIDPSTARLSIDVLQNTLLQDGALYNRRYLMKEIHTGMRHILVNILLNGVSKGVFRPEIARDAEKFAINLLGYLDGISLHFLISENYFDLKEQIEFSLQNIIRMIQIKPKQKGDTHAA